MQLGEQLPYMIRDFYIQTYGKNALSQTSSYRYSIKKS